MKLTDTCIKNERSDKDDIKILTARLRELELQQRAITRELQSIKTMIQEREQEGTNKEITTGSRVRLKTPGKFKCTTGTVTRVGKVVSVRLDTGRITTRKTENLEIITEKKQDEQQRK